MKTPVAAGRMVSVLGDVMENAAVDRVQKHTTLPAPLPDEVRIRAYLMFFSVAPLAVKTRPAS